MMVLVMVRSIDNGLIAERREHIQPLRLFWSTDTSRVCGNERYPKSLTQLAESVFDHHITVFFWISDDFEKEMFFIGTKRFTRM
jgi:hypothetical protein